MSNAIPQGWRRRSLSDLAVYENGFAFNDRHWSEIGLPIVRIAQITGSQGIVDRYPGRLPDTFRIDTGDLIFSWSGTLAVVRWTGGPAWLNQHLFKVVPDASVDEALLFHLLQASVAEMSKRTHGSTMKHIKRGELREFFVNLPVERDEQSKLAHVLDTLDTAIHQTEAIIAKLKAVKQGLLHDLLTRGIDANGELRPPQAEAPHLYKESPLGWIPNDWISGPLACWLDGKPKNGYSPQEAGEWTGIQMLGLGCLTLQGFQPLQLKPAPRGDKRLSSALLSDGDLLMSRANTRDLVGMVGVYRDVGTPCTYPDLMMRLRPSTETSTQFLQFVLQTSVVRRQVQAHAVGTSGSMVKISGKIVSNLVVAIPGKTEQNQILALLAAGDARLNAELEKVAVLRKLKAGLMDDLLMGRVRVTPLLAEAAQQPGSA
jgi:type I restriction enzyme S subunit